MNAMESEKLSGMFRKSLELDDVVDLETVEYGNSELWDSISHVMLMNDIEDQYGVTLDMDEMLDIKRYSDIVRILKARGILS